MARGNKICINGMPNGKFESAIIQGAYYPGICLTLKPQTTSTTFQGGRPQMEAYLTSSGSSDDPRAFAVLLEDSLQGKTMTTVLVSGQLAEIYWPLMGDDLNMLVKGLAGTGSANVVNVGDRWQPEAASGKLILQSTSGNRAPFQSMEGKVDETVDTDVLVWMKFGSF